MLVAKKQPNFVCGCQNVCILSIPGQMWALLRQKIVNREFCSKSPPEKWQYEDNFWRIPDDENTLGDFIEEISRPGDGKKYCQLCYFSNI